MIRGKKNFINPPKLELGVGFLFKIDESCLEAHVNDRKPKNLETLGWAPQMKEEIKEEKSNEEYTLVSMIEIQPRIKNFEKPAKGIKTEAGTNKAKGQQNNPKAEEKGKGQEQKAGKDKKEDKDKKDKENPNNQYQVFLFKFQKI